MPPFDKAETFKPSEISDHGLKLFQDSYSGKQAKVLDLTATASNSHIEQLFGKLTIVDDTVQDTQGSKNGATPSVQQESTYAKRYGSDALIGRRLTPKETDQFLGNGYVTEDVEGEREMHLRPLSEWSKEENGKRYSDEEILGRQLTGRQMTQFMRNETISEDPDGEKALGLKPLKDWVAEENGERYSKGEIFGRPLTVRQMDQLLRNNFITEDPEGEKKMHLQPLHEWLKAHPPEDIPVG